MLGMSPRYPPAWVMPRVSRGSASIERRRLGVGGQRRPSAGRAEQGRARDRALAETRRGVVERALDPTPLLVVVPQGRRVAARRTELLAAHAHEPHGEGPVERTEQPEGGVSDPLPDGGRLGKRL